jgi:hypothetical protein
MKPRGFRIGGLARFKSGIFIQLKGHKSNLTIFIGSKKKTGQHKQ